jgi:hypothetical protein
MSNLKKVIDFCVIKESTSIGIVSYLDFIDAINIKHCSKEFKNMLLPQNAVLIFKNYDSSIFDNSSRCNMKQYIGKIILSYEVSTIFKISSLLSIYPNIKELELSCVSIASDDSACNDIMVTTGYDSKNRILTKEFLNSEIFNKLKKMILHDSNVDYEVISKLKYNVDYDITYSNCDNYNSPSNACNNKISNEYNKFVGYWYELISHMHRRLCDTCLSRHIITLCDCSLPCPLGPQAIDNYLLNSTPTITITFFNTSYERYTNFGPVYINESRVLSTPKKIFTHPNNKKIQSIRSQCNNQNKLISYNKSKMKFHKNKK